MTTKLSSVVSGEPEIVQKYMEWVIGCLIGMVAGGMSGMFGIGGGVVIVPMLVYFLHFSQSKAQGTSLAILLPPIGVLAVMNYWRSGEIDLRVAAVIAAGFILGGWAGSRVSLALDESFLRKAFAVFLVVLAVHVWTGFPQIGATQVSHKDAPTSHLSGGSKAI